ncbi:hypothetical protein EPD60_07670 [Flaviaesturariibacter flavus]|uniref:Uncharacterized protein n=1 Tax=Flaviaesturariibacter flavus TaxID=2502780 RepID=A0A4R1BFT9_9BACT|nr:hypothetical protein [Flaviaesturariibacter flavus]TCJ15159.1 hypothetical protein EPD60_07920 [Flaviaesturariibacter flavus]TCJ15997.1 hypothetical protein EPD60_07670 [Flaviaesturariibacter flavus]
MVLPLLQSAKCQGNSFDRYLQHKGQKPIMNNYNRFTITLKNNCSIGFSKDDTLQYTNLITKDTIYPLISEEIGSGLKSLGGLFADFDSSFIWGIAMGDNIYGKIYQKFRPANVSGEFILISIYKNANQQYALMADPNYDVSVKKFFIYTGKKLKKYSLNNGIHSSRIKYLQIASLGHDKPKLIDSKTKIVYWLKP